MQLSNVNSYSIPGCSTGDGESAFAKFCVTATLLATIDVVDADRSVDRRPKMRRRCRDAIFSLVQRLASG